LNNVINAEANKQAGTATVLQSRNTISFSTGVSDAGVKLRPMGRSTR